MKRALNLTASFAFFCLLAFVASFPTATYGSFYSSAGRRKMPDFPANTGTQKARKAPALH